MNIKITGAADARDGYGEITQNMVLALDKLGHSVWLNPVSVWYNKDSLKKRTIELMQEIKPVSFELIIMYPVYHFDMINKKAAIITMYEANKCPDEWVKRLNSLRLPIFAPSQFVVDMFENSGVKVPISVMPLGVDAEFYSPVIRTYPKDRPFRFLTIGKLEPRKNTELLLSAFKGAFRNEPVELIIKTRERFLSSLARTIINSDTRIKLIEKTLSEEDLRALFYHADAFVYPSRGEGFSFPPRNAIATGLPTIVTGWSALDEISGAIKIKPCGFGPMPACGFSYGQENELLMANIDEGELMYEMLKLVNNKYYYNEQAQATFNTKQLTWEASAKILVKKIEAQL